ncbi:serine/threonine protein kinase [Helicocarpus griseus UAMH5409]|uniref:EKC/KEOPS complex subunit BUD32 n=1 Tax=Helicocarpus griseus UAMH5409 TaxID=1447875 RepID=A0A2B7X3T7_9EURO|nr:serine/threonine protein kinase [Helicocarpus griseus UAMH5409]
MSSDHKAESPRQAPSEQIFDFVDGNYTRDQRSLYRIYKRRRKAGPKHVSRCSDRIPIGECLEGRERAVRTDSLKYQTFEGSTKYHASINSARENIEPFFQKICPLLKDRFIIYGHHGIGTYDVIFAARERYPQPNCRPKHFVIKMEAHRPVIRDGAPGIGVYAEQHRAPPRYIQMEAIIMQLVSQCPRFPRLDSVYLHQDFQAIVMEADTSCFTPEQIDRSREITRSPVPRLKSCLQPGERLIDRKKPLLNEIQACKVASQLLEGIMYLMDLNISHDDLSHRNYLVDRYLNRRRNLRAPLQIHQTLHGDVSLYLPHDIRVNHLWKFGVLVYDLLHGYSPWELPGAVSEVGDVKAINVHERARFQVLLEQRRWRILNEELPVDEKLSQDCVDVLKAMLAKEVVDRPALGELVSFPWFQGHWVDHAVSEFEWEWA